MKSEKKIVGKVQSIDVFNKRIDNLIAMRGTGGYEQKHIVDEEYNNEGGDFEFGVQIWLYTNGTAVYVSGYIDAKEAKHYRYELPNNFRPIKDIEIYRDGNSALYLISGDGEYEPPCIEGNMFPKIDDNGDVGRHGFTFVYPIYDISVAELEDARVGYDGKEHETIGKAIREQVKTIAESIMHITIDAVEGDVTKANKTSGDIYTAYTHGKLPVFDMQGMVFYPKTITEDLATFSSVMNIDGAMLVLVSVDANGIVTSDGQAIGGGSADLGDIEEALDKIIELQNTLIGGGAK